MQTEHAIILLSGGLDSATCLAVAKSEHFTCHALSFSYGQKHAAELHAAQQIAAHFEVASHHVISLDPTAFSRSQLVDYLPNTTPIENTVSTYVPARNTVFLTYALAYAETLSASQIFIGVSSVDYSGYLDCRPAFIEAFQALANVAIHQPVQIRTPLLMLSKAETLQLGMRLGVDYSLTVSCYAADANGAACGQCESCRLRKKGFSEANLPDVTRYRAPESPPR